MRYTEGVMRERYIPEDAPTADQLLQLASLGMSSARKHKRMRTLKTSKHAHFFTQEINAIEQNEIKEDGEGYFIRHRMAGRVGKIALEETGLTQWSLKFFDAYWVDQGGGDWQAKRTRYRFEWNRLGATLAERKVYFLRQNDQLPERDIYDEIEHFTVRDDEMAFWHARNELSVVTRDDCELLIEDARRYFDDADAILDKVA